MLCLSKRLGFQRVLSPPADWGILKRSHFHQIRWALQRVLCPSCQMGSSEGSVLPRWPGALVPRLCSPGALGLRNNDQTPACAGGGPYRRAAAPGGGLRGPGAEHGPLANRLESCRYVKHVKETPEHRLPSSPEHGTVRPPPYKTGNRAGGGAGPPCLDAKPCLSKQAKVAL